MIKNAGENVKYLRHMLFLLLVTIRGYNLNVISAIPPIMSNANYGFFA